MNFKETVAKCKELGFSEELTQEFLWNEAYRLGRRRWYWGPAWFIDFQIAKMNGWLYKQSKLNAAARRYMERTFSAPAKLMPGPCVVCGKTDYPLSMGGPNICPQCDCGMTQMINPRNARNMSQSQEPQPVTEAPNLSVPSYVTEITAELRKINAQLSTLNEAALAILTNVDPSLTKPRQPLNPV